MFLMFRKQGQVDKNSINIYSNKYIKEFIKCIINILLKYARTVLYAKQYYQVLKSPYYI